MKNSPTSDEINDLFDNQAPEIAWGKANDVVRRINPAYDFTVIQSVYEDVLRMFHGEYPGYCAIKTPYHDLPHTLAALMCGVRLMHGVHVSGDRLKDDEITLMLIAILMHDIGYAQRKGEDSGTGAQFTQAHVRRGIEFTQMYCAERNLSLDMTSLAGMILGTEHIRPFAQIEFGNDRALMLARIVATADIVGQMADRLYLEKLLLLYLEFGEAKIGNYQNTYDLLRQTTGFYELMRVKLDGVLGGVHKKLEFYFKDTMGVDNNYYLEAIEKNIAYLSAISSCGEKEFSNMLRRYGIAERTRSLP